MSYIVTGGAGFIGSCILNMLNTIGISDILVVDNINTSEKWLNLRGKKYRAYYHKDEFLSYLPNLAGVTHIIHMGACSSTTEVNFDYLYKNNFEYTKKLWEYASLKKISFIYASSAATYGAGEKGFNDRNEIGELMPLNRYGYSKQIFDMWAQRQTERPAQQVGMKFFNVYGPNEYAKGAMASVILHGYRQMCQTGKIELYKSYRPDYVNGGQLRDFIYVKDICKVIKFFIEHPEISGLFNIGTGRAESFQTLAKAVFKAVDRSENIEYIEMPESLRDKYQYFTEADISKLRQAGYKDSFYSLTEGTIDYVQNFLSQNYRIW